MNTIRKTFKRTKDLIKLLQALPDDSQVMHSGSGIKVFVQETNTLHILTRKWPSKEAKEIAKAAVADIE